MRAPARHHTPTSRPRSSRSTSSPRPRSSPQSGSTRRRRGCSTGTPRSRADSRAATTSRRVSRTPCDDLCSAVWGSQRAHAKDPSGSDGAEPTEADTTTCRSRGECRATTCPRTWVSTCSTSAAGPATPSPCMVARSTSTGRSGRHACATSPVAGAQPVRDGRSPTPTLTRPKPGPEGRRSHRRVPGPVATASTVAGSGVSRQRSSRSSSRHAASSARRCPSSASWSTSARAWSRRPPHRSPTTVPTSMSGDSSANASIWGPKKAASTPANGRGSAAATHGMRPRCGAGGGVGALTVTRTSGGRVRGERLTATRPSPRARMGVVVAAPRARRSRESPIAMRSAPSASTVPPCSSTTSPQRVPLVEERSVTR